MQKRNYEIQGLRGIATLMVFFSHSIGIMKNSITINGTNLNDTPLRLLYGGESAVIIFFVLSGYFAYHSIKKLDYTSYKVYIFKRIIRLYPVFLITLICGTILCNLNISFDKNYFSEWFNNFWQYKIGIREFLKQCTMILNVNFNSINPPAWTLKYEMRIAFIIPLAIFILKKYRSIWVYILSLIISLIANNVSYFHVFVLGAILCKNESDFIKKIKRNKSLIYIIGVIGIFMIGFKYNFKIFSGKLPNTITIIIISLGWCLILLMINSLKSLNLNLKLLNNKFILLYGDISYSFYLIHFIVLLSMRPFMNIIQSYFIYVLIAFGITTILSYYSKILLEVKLKNLIENLLLKNFIKVNCINY